jgi:hypothetical protein
LDDEGFDHGIDTRASRIGAAFGAVELAGNQATIPSQDGLWFGDTGDLLQMLPPEALANLSECAPLRVGKPELSRDVGTEDSILCDQVFALEEHALVNQACHVRQQSHPLVIPHDEST